MTTALPPLLADAQVIDEQPDHIVVAIRIPRTTIAANTAFMAALADRAGHRPPMAATPPAARAAGSRWAMSGAVATAVMAAVILSPPPSEARGKRPYTIHHVQMDTPLVRSGGEYQFTAVSVLNRVCPSEVTLYIERGHTVIYLQNWKGFGRAPSVLPTPRSWRQPLPASIGPGDYTLRFTITHECDDKEYRTDSPPMAFTVTL